MTTEQIRNLVERVINVVDYDIWKDIYMSGEGDLMEEEAMSVVKTYLEEIGKT